jgi:predicted Zn-dependent protease
MTSPQIENLLKLIDTARDGALLRFSLGNEFLKSGEFDRAVEYLRTAVEKDAGYSAAWKMLGKALEAAGRREQALEAYRQGIEVAERKGDKQAAKEMTVYARRLEKVLPVEATTRNRS